MINDVNPYDSKCANSHIQQTRTAQYWREVVFLAYK